ncbi:MAG: lactate utilization protein [bacterium]|nr:lactate utilization protein [bacterium]MDE0600652.1 lactate utilization protein [bacterium]
MERSRFLGTVEEAVGAATLPGLPAPHPGRAVPDLAEVDLTPHFIEAFELLDGVVHWGAALEVITGIMTERGTEEFLSWDQEHLPADGLLSALAERGYRRISTTLPADPEGRVPHQMGYMDARVGISAAVAAFAESGSVVVTSGPGRSRLASVIPAVHVVLVPTDRIFRSLSHWAAQVESPGRLANLMVISGPSRTGDIELTLTRGVHGPGEIHAVLLQ